MGFMLPSEFFKLDKERDMTASKMHSTVVLLGGESEEREVSLASGENIVRALSSEGIEVDTWDWHPRTLSTFLSMGYERVFIALHGGSGEDGTVQGMLDLAGIPYTGVGMRTAAICMDKHLSKILVSAQTDILVPEFRKLSVQEAKHRLSQGDPERWSEMGALRYPMVVKPSRNGSSVGVSIVEAPEALDEAVRRACVQEDDDILFEQYIEGHELTVAVLNGKALGVCEICPKTKFYDYDAKYNRNDTEYLTPSSLGESFDALVCRQAEEAAQALDCRHGIVRIDFLADRALNPYFLEVNTVPGMTAHSLVPKIAAWRGIPFGALCRMILEMAGK